MSGEMTIGLPRGAWPWVIAGGALIGVLYALSPLTVSYGIAAVLLLRGAGRGVPADERRWLMAVLGVAILSRLLIVAALFATTNHALHPFGSLFGDEEYFVKRSLWLRNIALRIPVSAADFIYAYDDYSKTSYLWFLALFHVVFGPAPYGVHLISAVLYLLGSVLLYRVARPAFGGPAALLGLCLLLFLPSLFAWSISALKEPLFFALMGGSVVATVAVVRARRLGWRIVSGVFLVAAAGAAQTIREGGFAIAVLGSVGGLVLGTSIVRPRRVLTALLLAAILLPIVVTRGRVEDIAVAGVRQAAQVHWGHVNTPGYVYTFLAPRFYEHRSSIASMTFSEGVEFVIGAFVTYVTVPTPGQIKSRSALLFLPEQMVWYGLVILAPIGLLAALRRDPLVSSVLFAFALSAVVLVALSSGNVGTLVRHRGLAVPYIVWFSALGACQVVAWLAGAPASRGFRGPIAGECR
jgi:hypothetical protein